jgi:hypothetical protein
MNFKPTKIKLIISIIAGLILGNLFGWIYSFSGWIFNLKAYIAFSLVFIAIIYIIWSLFQRKIRDKK